jgi:hypothetical protein
MERHCRHHDENARNPQRRPVLTVAAGRRVPTEGNADGSGASLSPHHFRRYTAPDLDGLRSVMDIMVSLNEGKMRKTRFSVTIDRWLLRECDRHSGGASRSQIVESALAAWLLERRRRSLEEQIERYYASLSGAERKEDSRWADLALRTGIFAP